MRPDRHGCSAVFISVMGCQEWWDAKTKALACYVAMLVPLRSLPLILIPAHGFVVMPSSRSSIMASVWGGGGVVGCVCGAGVGVGVCGLATLLYLFVWEPSIAGASIIGLLILLWFSPCSTPSKSPVCVCSRSIHHRLLESISQLWCVCVCVSVFVLYFMV